MRPCVKLAFRSLPLPPPSFPQGKLTVQQAQQRRQLQAIAQFKVQRRQENMARRAAGA